MRKIEHENKRLSSSNEGLIKPEKSKTSVVI